MDRLHPQCLLLAKSSSSPGGGWGEGDTLPICCLAGAWAGVQSRSVGVEKLSLSSPPSWDHQLGLALRSMWDMEIPDCP